MARSGGSSGTSSSEQALADLADLHREIDARAAELAERHAARLRCGRGCAACCLDDLRVRPIEAAWIRRRHGALLESGEPHPVGACAFLDPGGACRIYADRPSVCRSQGLPLRILFEDERGEIVERRDICPLNLEGGPPLDRLDEDDCWLVGPAELRLQQLDERFLGESDGPERSGDEARVALRSLFGLHASERSSQPGRARRERSLPTTPR